ncbi:MAG TPA: PRC-barrel domain-containing protein [Patescibacteria group bacterium]|nr:PRC-barrel domain-containing protein [Patescibacteria group bacterium]
MMLLGSTLTKAPVMGLQTGSEIAQTQSAIIDPATLTVIAYVVEGPLLEDGVWMLRIADVRELSDLGFIVDSTDEFIHPEDVLKINAVYKLNFPLLDMPVVDEKRSKLGKVVDFTLETGSFSIQQLTVRRPLLKSFNDTELLIHRSQIIEINDDAIVVHSEAKAPEPELHEVVGSYVNPFRKSDSPAPESSDTEPF